MYRVAFWLLFLYCLQGLGQTNHGPDHALFSLPSLELSLQPAVNSVPSSTPTLAATSQTIQSPDAASEPDHVAPLFHRSQTVLRISPQGGEDVATDSIRSEIARAIYQRLDRQGVFDRPAVPDDNRVDRFLNNTFSPEVFRLGKTQVSCSLVTAIKRKNPLCLINPMFFNISW